MKMEKYQENKNILVTGSSKGLGLEITKLLLESSYNVYGISRNSNLDLEKYSNFKFIRLDLSNIYEVEFKIKQEIGNKIKVHGFVNNAALAYDDIITNLNLEKLSNMYNVNVISPLLLTKFLLRNMIYHNTKGSIVHISSISVLTGYNGLSMYASTKGALEAFSKNTAREWGRRGIRSNCVVAGFMETDMSSTLTQEQKNKIYSRTSLKQGNIKQSVANTVEFLLSEKNNSTTGQSIVVDNGTL
jgi:3-oxoacyl-[acyl-carrier protein] reductase